MADAITDPHRLRLARRDGGRGRARGRGAVRAGRVPDRAPAQGRDAGAAARASSTTHCGEHCIFLYTLVDERCATRWSAASRRRASTRSTSSAPASTLLARVAGYRARRRGRRDPPAPTRSTSTASRRWSSPSSTTTAATRGAARGRGRAHRRVADQQDAAVDVPGVQGLPGRRTCRSCRGVDAAARAVRGRSAAVFGLVTSAEVLARDPHRAHGASSARGSRGYADREAIEAELEEARALMRRIGCLVVHTDNRAVEETAQEIIRYLQWRRVETQD